MDRRKTDRRHDRPDDLGIPSLGDILAIFVKKRLLITFLLFIPILIGGLYLKQKPDQYKATATVLIENQQLNLADFQDILGDLKFDNLTVPTQVQVISSSNLAQETISLLNLTLNEKEQITNSTMRSNDALESKSTNYQLTQEFLKNLDVKQQGASRVIEISFSSANPEVAALIANGHAKQYVYSQINIKKKQAEHLDKWISGQIVQLKEESLKKSKEIQQFRADNGMVFGKNSQELVYQQISDIAAQLTPIETKELDLKAREEMLEGKSGSADSAVVESGLIQNLKAQASQASQKLQSLRADLGENHPEVIGLRKEVEQVNSDINRETKNIKKSIENELKTISKQKTMLQAKLEELQGQADILQEKQITLQALQVEESASLKLLDNFLARSEEVKSQINFTRPDVRIVSLADIPNKPSGSKKALLMLVLIMLSVVFALGTALLLELIDDGIQKGEDVKKLLNLKLLGGLPKEKNPIKNILEKKRTLYTEEIKRLYIHLSAQPEVKTILFSSALHDEGKSTISVSLAYYLNSIGKRTIIIDADTLSPTLAGITTIPAKPGFYELLSGMQTLESIIKKDKIGLDIIPSGESNSFVSDLLLAGSFEPYLKRLQDSYDYVIIDGSPILLASDAEVIARLVDQVVMVVAWAKTSRKNVKKAGEILRQFAKRTPYVILNKMNGSELKGK